MDREIYIILVYMSILAFAIIGYIAVYRGAKKWSQK